MRPFLLKLIFVAIVLQPLLDFAAGQSFQVSFFGKYWMPVQLVLMLSLYLWVISWPLESRRFGQTSVLPLPVGYTFVYGLILLAVFAQTLHGLKLGYYSALGDAETLFWILITTAIGWSTRLDAPAWNSLFAIVARGATITAILSAIYVLGHQIGGLAIPGFIYYNALFLIAFGFLVYLVRWLTTGNRKNRLLLTIFTATLLVGINKAIIFSLLLAVPPLLWLLIRSEPLDSAKVRGRLVSFSVTLVCVFGLLFGANTVVSTGLGKYFLNFWQDRVLHGSSLQTVDIRALTGGRTDLWDLSFYWLRQSPWVGQGIGFRLVKGLELTDITSGISAHDQYIYLLTALGIPAALVVTVGLLLYLRATLPRIQEHLREHRPAELVYPILGYTWTMLAFGLGGLWNIAPAGYALFGLCLGISLQFALSGTPSQIQSFRRAKSIRMLSRLAPPYQRPRY